MATDVMELLLMFKALSVLRSNYVSDIATLKWSETIA
jgi:hypothetical protein